MWDTKGLTLLTLALYLDSTNTLVHIEKQACV